MAPRGAIPWSETSRVAPHLSFRPHARRVPRFGWTRALLGWSVSYAGEPCLDGSDSRPFKVHNVLSINRHFERSFDRAWLFEGKGGRRERGDGGTM